MTKTRTEELMSAADRYAYSPTDEALESLLTAAHAYGLATGREGFVDPERVWWVSLPARVAELAKKLAGREAEIGEAYAEIARLRNGEAYKAIVKERDWLQRRLDKIKQRDAALSTSLNAILDR